MNTWSWELPYSIYPGGLIAWLSLVPLCPLMQLLPLSSPLAITLISLSGQDKRGILTAPSPLRSQAVVSHLDSRYYCVSLLILVHWFNSVSLSLPYLLRQYLSDSYSSTWESVYFWDTHWSSITHGTWDSNTRPPNFTFTPLYPHYLILGRQGRAEVALVSLRSDWLTLLSFWISCAANAAPTGQGEGCLNAAALGQKAA